MLLSILRKGKTLQRYENILNYANENAKMYEIYARKYKFLRKAREEHINMPGIDAIIGGTYRAAVRILSERNERC